MTTNGPGERPAGDQPDLPPPAPPSGPYPPPPVPPPPPAAYVPAPPPPPRRRGFPGWLVVVLIVVVICCLGAIIGAVVTIGRHDGPLHRATTKEASLGEPVRDGRFEFAVRSVTCGQESVGTEPIVLRATGQYCLAAMTVKNIGNAPSGFTETDQRGIGPNGVTYAPDTAAGLLVASGPAAFDDIDPGNQISLTLVFDIPGNSTIEKVELRDSSTSAGVVVDVG